jgi:hypothetical protein
MQIQKYHQEHRLIPEQKPHEHNPLFQLCTTLKHNLATQKTSPYLTTTWPNTHSVHTSQPCSSYPDRGQYKTPLDGG